MVLARIFSLVFDTGRRSTVKRESKVLILMLIKSANYPSFLKIYTVESFASFAQSNYVRIDDFSVLW